MTCVFFLLMLHLNTAQAAPGALPPLLQAVEKKYVQAGTISADFSETDEIAALKKTKKTSGTLRFRRPGAMRWEILEPKEGRSLLVSDGKVIWYYTPPFDADDSGQYWEKPAKEIESRFAQNLLTGSFSSSVARHDLSITEKSTTEFLMLPKKKGSGIKQAVLHVDPEKRLITGVDIVHRDGNHTQIELGAIELGAKLADSLFHFTPPPKTEKIDLK